MRRADALFQGVTLATPSPLLAGAIMARIQRRAAWMAGLRGGIILFLGVGILLGMVFVPMTALSGPVATVSNSPATVSVVIGVIVRIAGVFSALLGATYLVLRAVASSPGIVALVAYAIGAAALVLWWVRLVASPAAVTIDSRAG